MKSRVIIGLSGGVDSSVAAHLLQCQGYEVIGLFMKNWEGDDDDGCTAEQDLADAKAVCATLDIPLHTVNFAKDYWDRVFEHFLNEYRAGRTPNPDILCNKEIKFKAFLDYAEQTLDADFIATGHYVQKAHQNNEWQLLKGLDPNKDQSYFLYTLGQKQLAKSLFPIGNLEKPQVRTLAKELGFINHAKKDSTGICFIGERRFKLFLSEYLLAQPGDIETDSGDCIGRHDGLMYYTLGQREGIGIGGLKNARELPWYVIDKDLARNTLIIGQGNNHPRLFKSTLQANQLDWCAEVAPKIPLTCKAKTRYRQADQVCTIQSLTDGLVTVQFAEPQRAVTPGQSVVFYQGEQCLGGGVITG